MNMRPDPLVQLARSTEREAVEPDCYQYLPFVAGPRICIDNVNPGMDKTGKMTFPRDRSHFIPET